jgi:hypothetical protein
MDILIKPLVSLFLLVCLMSPALAAGHTSIFGPQMLTAESSELSESQAARLVQRNTGGKVLRVKDKGSYFQVKVLLPNGIVKSFAVDKITGTVD